jgi:hypothetical protein
MKIKAAELVGPALDWAVAQCEGIEVVAWWTSDRDAYYVVLREDFEGMEPDRFYPMEDTFYPSVEWGIGGPILDREGITWVWEGDLCDPKDRIYEATEWATGSKQQGPTALVAAMRCRVASKLGNEVEVPDELLEKRAVQLSHG